MKRNEGRLVGILGTVIIHIIAGIIFMSFQIRSLQKVEADDIIVEFAPAEEVAEEEKLIELPVSAIEKILQGDQEMLNIAKNLANKSEQKIDPADYIDMVKEELIKSGKLGADNYIDEQKKQAEETKDENLAYDKKSDEAENKKLEESQKMASNYKGPTRIYYDLKGRTHRYLPIPIYLCQGSGKKMWMPARLSGLSICVSTSKASCWMTRTLVSPRSPSCFSKAPTPGVWTSTPR